MANSGTTWGAQADEMLNQELEEYRDEHDLSKSETVRQLLRDSLEDDERGEPWYLDPIENVAGVSVVAAVVLCGFFVAGYSTFALPALVAAALTIASNYYLIRHARNS